MNNGPISWRTLLAKGHCMSPTDSEYTSMYHAVKEVLSLRNLMEEIGFTQNSPTTIYEDNEGVIKIANNPRCHDNMKYIELKKHLTRDAIESGSIIIEHIATENQVADIMTKPLTFKNHWKHANKMIH